MKVDRDKYVQTQEAGNAAENMDTIYHESRHGEQWWNIGRLLAGLYDMDGAAINKQTSLKLDIAERGGTATHLGVQRADGRRAAVVRADLRRVTVARWRRSAARGRRGRGRRSA